MFQCLDIQRSYLWSTRSVQNHPKTYFAAISDEDVMSTLEQETILWLRGDV